MASKETLKVLRKLDEEMAIPEEILKHIGWIVRIMYKLRAPGGCSWDRAQTHESLLKNLLEESYEFVDTVNNNDDVGMREELGDLLMQVVFHAEVADERGAFDLGDVAHDLAEKLVRRHPHVFGDQSAASEAEALDSWNNAKKKEGIKKFSLEEIPQAMPALLRSRKIQEKAGRVGFEWPDIKGALAKVDEELEELKEAIEAGNDADIADELGDLLFVVVNVARYVKQCPEVALTSANEKFLRRFRHIEKRLAESGRTPSDATREEMDVFWDEAKAIEKSEKK